MQVRILPYQLIGLFASTRVAAGNSLLMSRRKPVVGSNPTSRVCSGVAQWQSGGLLNRRLRVRVPPPEP